MTEILQFAGRFHPVLVHLPIGILLLAGALELAAWLRQRRARGQAPAGGGPAATGTRAIVVLGAATAIAAAVPGYLLGATGGYAGPTYEWHLRLGTLVALSATLTAVAAILRDGTGRGGWTRAYAGLLAVTLALVAAAGHLGATLAHGEGYLTNHAPAPLRDAVARLTGRAAADHPAVPPGRTVIYTALVEPVLAERCVSCHGPHRAEGGLRLDSQEGIAAGGLDGAVIVPGRAADSDLVRRIWLPASHPDVMPPRGNRPPSPAEAALLRWWIDGGASFEQTLGDADVPSDMAAIVEAIVGPLDRGPTVPDVPVPAPAAAALEAARGAGLSVAPIAEGSPFLQAHCGGLGRACDDERLRALEGLAANVLWLDLGGSGVTDDGLAVVGRFPHLTRLQLQRTAVGDAGVRHLADLRHLETVNLYGTRVTDAGLAPLAELETLRTVYVWQTGVTEHGAARAQAGRPRLRVELGGSAPVEAAGAKNSAAPRRR